MKCLPAILILFCISAEPIELTPSERAEFAAEQMVDVASLGQGLPSEQPRRLGEVIDFEIIKGRILPITPIKENLYAIQPLTDDPGRCYIHRAPLQLDLPADETPFYFQFQIKRFDPKTLAVETIDISRVGESINMSLIVVGVNETQHIQISDPGAQGMEGDGGLVRLFCQTIPTETQVVDHDGEIRPASPTTTIAAENLAEMIRLHREDALPILRRFFTSLKRPDIVARAMENTWIRVAKPWLRSPDDLVNQVNALVKQLDSNEYADRQKTFDALFALGEPARLVLITIDSSTLSDEQRSSVSALLEPVGNVEPEELERISNSAIELVDGLYANSPIVREAIRRRIESLTKTKLELDPIAAPSNDVIESIRATIANLSDQP